MHTTYTFHFLNTVSQQLKDLLESLPFTPLNDATLAALRQYQTDNDTVQGVYLITIDGVPRYVGKADDVADRLTQHLRKLSGRRNIDLAQIGYKALLLDKSMSTAANEGILIQMFKESHGDLWNGTGFGSKDPGAGRDNTRPGPFDRLHPIREDFPVENVNDVETIGSLLEKMKPQLPYTAFRYEIDPELRALEINLRGVPRDALSLVSAVVEKLGAGWKGVVLSFGMVIYKTNNTYRYGREILP